MHNKMGPKVENKKRRCQLELVHNQDKAQVRNLDHRERKRERRKDNQKHNKLLVLKIQRI